MTLPAWMTGPGMTPWYAAVTAAAVVTSAILSAQSVVLAATALGCVLSRPSANFTLSEGLSRLGGGEPLARELPAQISPSTSAMNQGPSPAPGTWLPKSRALGK